MKKIIEHMERYGFETVLILFLTPIIIAMWLGLICIIYSMISSIS